MIKLTDAEIAVKLAELNKQVSVLLPCILELTSSVMGRNLTIQQFHAIIGAKNNPFANIATGQYTSPEAFQTEWAEKMIEYYEPRKMYWHTDEDIPNVIRLYRDKNIRQ